MNQEICTICNKPKPSHFCWQGVMLDCPFRMPPRNLTVENLWPIIVRLHERIIDAES